MIVGTKRRTIGFDRKIQLNWLDATADWAAQGLSVADIRAKLEQLLEGQVAGSRYRGARDKTTTVLLHVWVKLPNVLIPLRDDGLALLRDQSGRERLPIHWGMCVATYPFFRDVAATTGRLLSLQGTAALSQIVRRMTESWGERTTLIRAVQRVVRSFVEWGVLVEADERGIFSSAPKITVGDGNGVGPWLLEAGISNCERQARPFRSLVGAASFFPLKLKLSPHDVGSSPRLEVYRQGLDEDLVMLRSGRTSTDTTGVGMSDNLLEREGDDKVEDSLVAESTFFSGKRPWSKIKDQVLASYMPAYLAKVAKLGKRIILIDAFAGPGQFDDGSDGSPLIICQAAERYVPGQYQAVFVNRENDLHQKLTEAIRDFSEKGSAVPIQGTATDLLSQVEGQLSDQTVFLYLDPFGLKGCEFSTIRPFLQRDKRYSTEVVINLSVPTMHRLAARKAVSGGRGKAPLIKAFHRRLSAVLGGDYWTEHLWDEDRDPEERAAAVMQLYRERFAAMGLPYTGSCPVREEDGSGIKYYITFCSRHPDAMLLMNDSMCRAYQQRMHEAATNGTLFVGLDWKETRGTRAIDKAVVDMVSELPGKSRKDLWIELVQRHFMRFMASEFNAAVQRLVKANRLRFEDVKGTGRLNDLARLHVVRDESR